MPRPNAAWRFSFRARVTLAASGNTAGSRFAAGNDSSTMLPVLTGQPETVVSLTTSRAIVTGEYARKSSSIAVGISPGSVARRLRSLGVLARCHIEEPIALQVVS